MVKTMYPIFLISEKLCMYPYQTGLRQPITPTVRELSLLHRVPVARLMSRLKPEWWDLHEAVHQLNICQGWYIAGADGSPSGWLAARPSPLYRTVEIECMGYDALGTLAVGPQLTPLVDACERWAVLQGMVNLRFVVGSRGLSCHNKKIDDPGKELHDLKNLDRDDFDWLLSLGFRPSGILPEIYGNAYHGIILIKVLQQDLSSLLGGIL
jgi:hypothetical protein